MEPEYIYYPADELRYDHLRNYYGILEVKEPHAELDLGCGSGSFTVALACRYPESRIYAADMLKGRLKKLIKRADNEYCFNIYPMQVEARYLLGPHTSALSRPVAQRPPPRTPSADQRFHHPHPPGAEKGWNIPLFQR